MTQFLSFPEARRFFSIGLPIFIAQLAQTGMTFVDCTMTGHYNARDMAAIAVAGSLWAPLSMIGIGIMQMISPLCAQFIGQKDTASAATLLRQSFWLVLSVSGLLLMLFSLLSHSLPLFGLDEEMAELSGSYLRALMWGLPFFLIFISVRGYFEGFSRTRPAMVIGLLTLLVNIPLNYVLIYGRCGLPELGAVGCGYATTVCYMLMALLLLVYLYMDPQTRALDPLQLTGGRFSISVRPALLKRVLRIGVPSALSLTSEVALFAISAILLAPLGTTMVAGHQIAMSFGTVIFMVPLSLGMTATIRVAYALGRGDAALVTQVTRTALSLAVLLALVLCLGTILLRLPIVSLYTTDPSVTLLAAHLLLLQAAYQIVDGLQCMGASILRGHNDTRIISAICLLSYLLIGIPTGYILARTTLLTDEPMGAAGFWISYIIALGVCAVAYLLRIRYLQSEIPSRMFERIRR